LMRIMPLFVATAQMVSLEAEGGAGALAWTNHSCLPRLRMEKR
jgi:hypothetical protein